MKRLPYLMFVTCCLGHASTASAASFAIGQQGAAAEGLAGAATAREDLADVAWYNPAATPAGLVLSLGASVLFPTIVHTDPESGVETESESGAATPPWIRLGYVHGLDRHRFGLFAMGSVPYGAGLQWPETWSGRFEVTSVALRVYEASANAVYGVSLPDDLELGAGLQLRLLRGTFELGRRIDTVNDEASVQLGGVGNATAYGASLFGRFHGLTVGANLRTGVPLDIAGDAHFENVPVELSGPAHDQPFTTVFELPTRLATGAAYDLGFGTTSVDVEYTGWSRIQTFEIDFADEETSDASQPRGYRNTVAVKLGYEHRLLDDRLALRGGFAFDPAPTPTTTLSPSSADLSRLIGTLGAGYTFDFGLRIDAAYGHMALLEGTASDEELFPGTYRGAVDIVSLGVSWSAL